MPIIITCHGCKKRFQGKDALAGRTVPCPACGTMLEIARPVAVPEKAPEAPPFWLRHLHWLLIVALVPLAVSLLQGGDGQDLKKRLAATMAEAPDEDRGRVLDALGALDDGGSLDDVFRLLPGRKLKGAFLARDTIVHWHFTLVAAGLFFAFLFGLCLEGSAKPEQLLAVGAFTGVIGVMFLLCVQTLAMWSQGVIFPRGIVGIIFWILKLIGMSYRAALDPHNGFWLSLVGFTLGVGLCEEICKAIPIIVRYRWPNGQTWLGAYLWGLASGGAFGLAEGLMYAGDFYNGINGPGTYVVRYFSCVALHALWTGSAAISIHKWQHLFQEEEMGWLEWLLRSMAVVAVPMVLHGLYDTLLKKEMNALALVVALASFGYLAFQISRLRGVDDQSARRARLQEFLKQRGVAPRH